MNGGCSGSRKERMKASRAKGIGWLLGSFCPLYFGLTALYSHAAVSCGHFSRTCVTSTPDQSPDWYWFYVVAEIGVGLVGVALGVTMLIKAAKDN